MKKKNEQKGKKEDILVYPVCLSNNDSETTILMDAMCDGKRRFIAAFKDQVMEDVECHARSHEFRYHSLFSAVVILFLG